jgi:hypothetical protein
MRYLFSGLFLAAALLFGSPAFAINDADPSSSFTLTTQTTAYSATQWISPANGVIPSFVPPGSPGGLPTILTGVRLISNDPTSTAWPAKTIQVDLWAAAPTMTNGDRAAYLIATGSAGYLGSFSCTMIQGGDGAYGRCSPLTGAGTVVSLRLQSGTPALIYWTLEAISGSGVTGVSTTMTLYVESAN